MQIKILLPTNTNTNATKTNTNATKLIQMQLKQIQSRLPYKEKWNVDKTPKLPPKIHLYYGPARARALQWQEENERRVSRYSGSITIA